MTGSGGRWQAQTGSAGTRPKAGNCRTDLPAKTRQNIVEGTLAIAVSTLWGIVGLVRGESFFKGRPTSYWKRSIQQGLPNHWHVEPRS
jgi:hypothetical protein